MAVNNNGPRNPNLAPASSRPARTQAQTPAQPTATKRDQGRQKSVDFADKSNMKFFAKGKAMDGSRDIIKTSTKPAGPIGASPKSQVGCVVHVPGNLHEPVSVTWQSGQVYKGEVNAQAQPHGEGFLIQDDGTEQPSTWVNGRCTGVDGGRPVPPSVEAYVDRPGNPKRVSNRIAAQTAAAATTDGQGAAAGPTTRRKAADAAADGGDKKGNKLGAKLKGMFGAVAKNK